MTKDYSIGIAPDPAGVCFTMVGPNLPQAGVKVIKPLVPLAEKVSNQLRLGTATPALANDVQASTSEWLLGQGLDVVLSTALSGNGGNGAPIRVIWNVDPRLRPALAETPFEIVRPNGGGIEYALNPKIQSFTHLLEKVGTPPTSAGTRAYPLRCLIVRSNPPDLGSGVPPAQPIASQIEQYGAHLLPKHLRVSVLSSESGPNVIGRPTFKTLDDRLREGFDLLVYIGHGDLLSSFEGLPPVGVLQLESEDGLGHESIPSNKLALLLHTAPVPVVLLLGCLTAADVSSDVRSLVLEQVPQWMRGAQGVAQALVNSESGVQLAIGMRYRTEAGDATLFVDRFFRSLLQTKPGHVEAAVHYARQELNLHGNYPLSWSAPMVFSALAAEPLFGFLATPPGCPVLEQHGRLRSMFWSMMSKIPLPATTGEIAVSIRQQLDVLDADVVNAMTAGAMTASARLLMPMRVEATPAATAVVPIHLHGAALDVQEVQGRVIIDGPDARLERLTVSPAAQAAGFALFDASDSDSARTFILRRKAGATAPLAAGHVMTAEVRANAAGRTALLVSLDQIETTPAGQLCSAPNAVLVFA